MSDLQKSIDFYNSFFASEPVKIKLAYAKYVLENPSLIISFVENKERVKSNFGHLGFQVETVEDLNIKLWEAKKKNIVSKEEIGTTCCYAKQDKFWATDPDGVQWEVYYFHEDAEFNDPHYESSEASACCTPADKSKINLNELVAEKPCC